MRAAALLVALGACGHDSGDLVPPELQKELVFVPATILLQPDDRAPTFTLSVPAIWEQDKNLVGFVGGRSVLVNGGGTPLTDREFSTEYGDPNLEQGHFALSVTCAGACGDAFVDKMFASWRKDKEVLDERGGGDDRMQVTRNDEGRTYAMHAWRPKGDDRWRVCWVSIGKRYKAAYRAFAKSCAEAVENPRR